MTVINMVRAALRRLYRLDALIDNAHTADDYAAAMAAAHEFDKTAAKLEDIAYHHDIDLALIDAEANE